jgi:hypothetical protein
MREIHHALRSFYNCFAVFTVETPILDVIYGEVPVPNSNTGHTSAVLPMEKYCGSRLL